MKTVKGKQKPKVIKEQHGLYCTECHTVVVSLNRHDFVSCKCGPNKGIFIDGGYDYVRFGGNGIEKGNYEKVLVQFLEKEGKEDEL